LVTLAKFFRVLQNKKGNDFWYIRFMVVFLKLLYYYVATAIATIMPIVAGTMYMSAGDGGVSVGPRCLLVLLQLGMLLIARPYALEPAKFR
jgi:hypothetical protein